MIYLLAICSLGVMAWPVKVMIDLQRLSNRMDRAECALREIADAIEYGEHANMGKVINHILETW